MFAVRTVQCTRNTVCSCARGGETSISGRATQIAPSRRDALLAVPAVLTALSFEAPQPAKAGPVGEAIASLWKGRQQANSVKILAPIKVAQQRLANAMQLMDSVDLNQDAAALQPVLAAVRNSSLNCYVFEALPDDSIETKASLASQQFQFSDPCTFRLIVKNITGLSSSEERRQGEELVAVLIRSYQKLDGELEGAIQGSVEAGEAARRQLKATVDTMNELESYVHNVLAV